MRPEELRKGDLIIVRWTDASDTKATLEEHVSNPETGCTDWGIFLGVSGAKRRFVIVGKALVVGTIVGAVWGKSQ